MAIEKLMSEESLVESMTYKLMSDAFNKVLNYQSINEMIGDWHIANPNCPNIMDLMYRGDALYSFSTHIKGKLGATNSQVQFINYHREAKKGTGTLSLKQLESAFSVLAKERNQKVVVFFNVGNQEDTEAWLKKNEYILRDGSRERKLYEKVFDSI